MLSGTEELLGGVGSGDGDGGCVEGFWNLKAGLIGGGEGWRELVLWPEGRQ